MHPFFTRPAYLLAYVGSWLGLALLASFALSYPDGSLLVAARIIMPSAFLFSFVSLSSWYLCRAYPIRETRPAVLAVSILSSSILIGSALGAIIVGTMILFGDMPESSGDGSVWPFKGAPLLIGITGVILYLLSVMFHYLLIAFESSRSAERRSLEAEIHARSFELKALRAQIDPHFLFNSLNSIAALIAADAERARTMTVHLAEFFRASVAAGQKQLVPFSQELDLIQAYLDIEAVRYGKRLSIELERDSQASSVLVPPLLLQPLVENAIKHGIAHMVDGGIIRIETKKNGDILTVRIANDLDPDTRVDVAKGTRFGIQAVRDRLKALAPGRAFLDIRQHDSTFEAIISLPTDLDG